MSYLNQQIKDFLIDYSIIRMGTEETDVKLVQCNGREMVSSPEVKTLEMERKIGTLKKF